MKYLLVLLVSLLSLSNINAQTFTPSKSVSSSTQVGEVTIAGKTFKGGESSTGSIYIMRVSKKSGEEYKSYLGMPLKGKNYNGSQIFTANSKGEIKYYYFTINPETGYPKRNYLDAN
jgi:hypothetical protein